MANQKKTFTQEEAYLKVSDYCARQDRTRKDVLKKLYDYGVDKDTALKIILNLEKENFINQDRFAQQYTSGKFNIKKWGKRKIAFHMNEKGVEKTCIESSLQLISPENYVVTLRKLLDKKFGVIKENNPFMKSKKLAAYAIRKGYEPELVYKMVKETTGISIEDEEG